MLINLSNHPSLNWQHPQINAAENKYDSVTDIPFPDIDPELDTDAVSELATIYLSRCHELLLGSNDNDNAIHVSGEPCFVFQFVTLAKNSGITCICSTTKRVVSSNAEIKTSIFEFVKFRKY